MDASRMLEVLTEIGLEFRDGYTDHLQALLQAYTVARDSPSKDSSSDIAGARAILTNYLLKSPTNDYPPSKRHILESIGGADLIGRGAELTLQQRLTAAGPNGAAALVATVTEFSDQLGKFKKSCATAESSPKALQIEPHQAMASTP